MARLPAGSVDAKSAPPGILRPVVRIAPLFLLLALACGSSPRKDFDQGVEVHFILFRKKAPSKDVTLKPIFTVGAAVEHAPEITFGPDHDLAMESGIVLAQRGDKTRFSFWDPNTRTGSRDTFDLEHELWILVDLAHLGPGQPARFIVFDYPPNQDLQEWKPLVRFPE